MVRQIIPPLLESDQTQLIQETISSIRQVYSVPTDMTVNNFQTAIGGQIQGLIGAKHLQEFPVPVMHLSNGLSIYKHSLRPAGSRSQVYCIGGTLPVLSAFKKAYGPHIHQVTNLMLQSEIAFINDPVFDGDVHATEDCQVLDQATIKATNTAPESMQVFYAAASKKTLP